MWSLLSWLGILLAAVIPVLIIAVAAVLFISRISRTDDGTDSKAK